MTQRMILTAAVAAIASLAAADLNELAAKDRSGGLSLRQSQNSSQGSSRNTSRSASQRSVRGTNRRSANTSSQNQTVNRDHRGSNNTVRRNGRSTGGRRISVGTGVGSISTNQGGSSIGIATGTGTLTPTGRPGRQVTGTTQPGNSSLPQPRRRNERITVNPGAKPIDPGIGNGNSALPQPRRNSQQRGRTRDGNSRRITIGTGVGGISTNQGGTSIGIGTGTGTLTPTGRPVREVSGSTRPGNSVLPPPRESNNGTALPPPRRPNETIIVNPNRKPLDPGIGNGSSIDPGFGGGSSVLPPPRGESGNGTALPPPRRPNETIIVNPGLKPIDPGIGNGTSALPPPRGESNSGSALPPPRENGGNGGSALPPPRRPDSVLPPPREDGRPNETVPVPPLPPLDPGIGNGEEPDHGHGGHDDHGHCPWTVWKPRACHWWFDYCRPIRRLPRVNYRYCNWDYVVSDYVVPGALIVEDARWYCGLQGMILPGKGLGVEAVDEGSPADLAGLAPGMVITRCNGIDLVDETSLAEAIEVSHGLLEMQVIAEPGADPVLVSVALRRLPVVSY